MVSISPCLAARHIDLEAGKLTVDEDEFAVSNDLRDIGRSVSTALGLQDENLGVKLIVQVHGIDVEPSDKLVHETVRQYHDRRLFLVQDIRHVLQESIDQENEEGDKWRDVVRDVLEIGTGPHSTGSAYLRKCLRSMGAIEDRFYKVSDDLQAKQVLSIRRDTIEYESLEFQKTSYFQQHEALSAVLTYLFRSSFCSFDDLRELVKVIVRWKQPDFLLVHYLPAFSAAFRLFGSSDHSSSREDADSLTSMIKSLKEEAANASMQPFFAVLSSWWIVEYSSWFRDLEDIGSQAAQRSEMLRKSLSEHALQFQLSLCTQMDVENWRHPARHEMLSLLLRDSRQLVLEEEVTADFFRTLYVESLESFAEAWITNMPDQIRELKIEEDQQRLMNVAVVHEPEQAPQAEPVVYLHLEALLILISFAFENRPTAAREAFWHDTESNLFGFLQWTSKRQTVPRASAFCEMLCAIAQGAECSEAAHKFLLEETIPTSGRGRRHPSMGFQQIFLELDYYSRKVHERPATSQMPQIRKEQFAEMNEAESPIMLSCYLRLLSHMCRETELTRHLVLNHPSNVPDVLLRLCSGPVPTYLRGSIFGTLESLLSSTIPAVTMEMWRTIDHWAASITGFSTDAGTKPDVTPSPSLRNLSMTLTEISAALDQTEAFVSLLCRLMVQPREDGHLASMTSFPADLGSSYRTAGVTPYIDWTFEQVFTKITLGTQSTLANRGLTFNCLNLIAGTLESFNEDFAVLLSRPSIHEPLQGTPMSYSPETYARIHPFARVMRWLFGNEASRRLISATSVDGEALAIDVNDHAAAGAIGVTERALDALILVLDLQPTYLDIIKPLTTDAGKQTVHLTADFDRFEDAISTRPRLVQDLCAYAAADNDFLIYRALNLLKRLSVSKRLNYTVRRGDSSRTYVKTIVDMLGPNANADLDPVVTALAEHLSVGERELEAGPDSRGYEIKDIVLSFFTETLRPRHSLPNIIHLLLGFTRTGDRLDIDPNGRLAAGSAVFDSVLALAQDYPDNTEEDKESWLLHIKTSCMLVLEMLWSTPISKDIVLSQLRRYKFLQYQFGGQSLISRNTLWDGLTTSSPEFWFGKHAEGFISFLQHRAALFDYAAIEIRAAAASGLTGRQRQCLSTVLGKSSSLEGVELSHPSIQDLFDFVDLDIGADMALPDLKHFADINFQTLISEPKQDQTSLYLLDSIRELMHNEIRKIGSQADSRQTLDNLADAEYEADVILSILNARNSHLKVQSARKCALRSWVELILTTLYYCRMDATQKIQFVLRVFQSLLPKLDSFIIHNNDDAVELARAAEGMLTVLMKVPEDQIPERMADIITDRLFQLFRVCMEAITKFDADRNQRHLFYNICYQYLTRIRTTSATSIKIRSRCLDTVRSSGPTVVLAISNDAEDGIEAAKPAALNLLAQLTWLARDGKSNFVVETMTRANTIEVLIEPIKYLAADVQQIESNASLQYLLTVFDARMLFLTELSRTRDGAAAILDAGLLQTIRDSAIFMADPDLGIGQSPSSPSASCLRLLPYCHRSCSCLGFS